ncbi:MAG: DUF354 domain-containing protein [Asgard group archaeon]|nr:DUF354 domain-containing protein [Asgard group archaeon]
MASKKTIWFDTLTPKQTMLFIALAKIIQKYGFECHFTTRKHDYVHDIFRYNKIPFHSFGSFGGKTLEGKLLASAKRVVKLTEHITSLESKPIAAISFSSPDASRVAFGLGIPLILLNDTAHSVPVAKLTFSLARYLITPSCIKKDTFTKYGAKPNIIHTYEGVDEVEYISGENYDKYLQLRKGISKEELIIVFRPEESFASYMKNPERKLYLDILQEIIDSTNAEIYVFPRYPKQKETILKHFKDKITIPKNGMYYLDLLSKAKVVITGGGTMGREAALLGIPSITYFWRHLEPQKFIEEKGFPSFSVQKKADIKKLVWKICQNPERYTIDTTKKLQQIQKPSDVLLPLLKNDPQLKKYFE